MPSPFNNIGMHDELLCQCLDIARAQKQRRAETFKPGSAANKEILEEVEQIRLATSRIHLSPTPLEDKIAASKETKK